MQSLISCSEYRLFSPTKYRACKSQLRENFGSGLSENDAYLGVGPRLGGTGSQVFRQVLKVVSVTWLPSNAVK